MEGGDPELNTYQQENINKVQHISQFTAAQIATASKICHNAIILT
jgi:hypothetical protein